MRPLGPESLEGACLFQRERDNRLHYSHRYFKISKEAAILADEIKPDFDGVDADLVIIATPSNLHASQARELLSKGYHVLVEKPLGCSESEAAQVLANAREFGRILGVGLLLRFHPAVTLANQMINSGELGRIESLRFVRRTTRDAPENGNVVEALGVHAIDLMCHFMSESEPSAVHVQGDKIEARIALEFPHGIEAIIDVGWQTTRERRTVTLVGSNASLRFDLDVHDRVTLILGNEETEIFCDSTTSPLNQNCSISFQVLRNSIQDKHGPQLLTMGLP